MPNKFFRSGDRGREMLDMCRKQFLTLVFVTLTGLQLMAQGLSGQPEYVLTTSPSQVNSVSHGHGLNVKSTVWHHPNYGYAIFLVTDPSGRNSKQLQAELSADSAAISFEPNQSIHLPELSGTTSASLAQSTESILDSLPGRTIVSFNGVSVPSNYVQQPATTIIRWNDALTTSGLTGAGTVAIIDTGVDIHHPALVSVLVSGYDFTRNLAGGSEMADIGSNASASLSQSTESILDSNRVSQLSNSTLAILTQSTESILDGTPPAFGHGTMTAGLVHLIAPTARIMPLKAFNADGTSDTASIVRAIYYATDQGADIISMSFELAQESPSLAGALDYAQNHGLVTIAAAGNDAWSNAVYPAAGESVIGVGSTNDTDQRSSFSNFSSPDVMFAAPGEGVISTYPGNNYAAGWGTSFSAPMVAGAAALIFQDHRTNVQCNTIKALAHAIQVPQMGYGRIDLYQALMANDPIPGFSDTSCEPGHRDSDRNRPD
jgi:subtilisin family serine protease